LDTKIKDEHKRKIHLYTPTTEKETNNGKRLTAQYRNGENRKEFDENIVVYTTDEEGTDTDDGKEMRTSLKNKDWIIDMDSKQERKIVVYTSRDEDSDKKTNKKDKMDAESKNRKEQNDRVCKITEEKTVADKETKMAAKSSKNKEDEVRIYGVEQKVEHERKVIECTSEDEEPDKEMNDKEEKERHIIMYTPTRRNICRNR